MSTMIWRAPHPGLLVEAQARPADINLIARAQALAAPVAGRHFDGAAFAEDARAEFAFVIAAFFKDDIVAAHDALLVVCEFLHASDVGAELLDRVAFMSRLAAHYLQAAGRRCRLGIGRGHKRCRRHWICRRRRRGGGLRLANGIRDFESFGAFPGRLHIHREAGGRRASGALQGLADIVFQPAILRESRLKQRAPLRLRGHQPHAKIVIREKAPPALYGLDLAFDFLEYGAMHQQQFVGLGGSEGALGPLAESALDGLLHFRKETHGCFPAPISPKLCAAVTSAAAAGAAYVPPYWPFSISTANAMRLPAGYGANPINQACEGASASSAVPVLPAICKDAWAARRPVP